MFRFADGRHPISCGIQFCGPRANEIETAKRRFQKRLDELEIGPFVEESGQQFAASSISGFRLRANLAINWAPDCDTSQLHEKLQGKTTKRSCDLEREILVAMLIAPVAYQFSSFEELASAVRIRENVVAAAHKTSLAFATTEAERPAEYWHYDPDRGFILRPGEPLIEAIERATQPDVTGKRYTFSCRRAVEHVFLLAIAREVSVCNTQLFRRIHQQAESRALKGSEFENVFLRQVGSPRRPMPLRFFVPGDRTWFRNPDELSSDVTGFEGSWTFYLGKGQFADFWRQDQIFNLTLKCLSIYHWRHATYRDEDGELQIDERLVETLVERTLKDSAETERIMQIMLQLQEPIGTYAGGCIEAHRELPRQVRPGTTDLVLPDIEFEPLSTQSVA